MGSIFLGYKNVLFSIVRLEDRLWVGELKKKKWTRRDLNPRPPRCERGALLSFAQTFVGLRSTPELRAHGLFELHSV